MLVHRECVRFIRIHRKNIGLFGTQKIELTDICIRSDTCRVGPCFSTFFGLPDVFGLPVNFGVLKIS